MSVGITQVVSYEVNDPDSAGVTPTGFAPEITVVVKPSDDLVKIL